MSNEQDKSTLGVTSEMTSTPPPSDSNDKKPSDVGKKRCGGRIAVFVIGVVVGAALTGLLMTYAGTALQTASEPSLTTQEENVSVDETETEEDTESEVAVESDNEEADEACNHEWQVIYETVHHEAVTHTETVDAVYEDQTTYHTVCNECQEVIDGEATQHIKETEHSGYSTNVPITNTVLVSESYTEEVTDTPAYDEQVATELICPLCGETYELEVDAA